MDDYTKYLITTIVGFVICFCVYRFTGGTWPP